MGNFPRLKPIAKQNKSVLFLLASSLRAKHLPQECSFATWSNLVHPGASPFSKTGDCTWSLPELTEAEKAAVISWYNEVIASIGVENGPDSLWWYTWTSSRDRFYSRILSDMELLARFRKACDEGIPPRLALVCQDPHLAAALIDIARQNGITATSAFGDRLRWTWQRIRTKVTPVVGGFRACQRAFAQKRIIGRKKIRFERSDMGQEKTLIVTWLKSRNLLHGGPTTDTFFGRLPEFIKSGDRSVVMFGDLLDTPESSMKNGRIDSSLPILAAGEFFDTSTMFGSFFRSYFPSIRVTKSLNDKDPALASLIKRDIQNNKGSVLYGLLFEGALRSLCKIYRPTQIIHSCENNPWERACARVARTMDHKPQVTGFMHCSVLLSHPKIIISGQEKPVRPRPTKLVCTGPRARDIMIKHGGHSPEETVAGCALRHEYLWQMKPRESVPRTLRNILVVLDGLPTMPGYVRFICEALDGNEEYRTVLRPHPVDSQKRILEDADILSSAFKTLSFSANKNLNADLEDADLLIYKGSTAAIEAGYLGIPLIHVDFRSILNNDPLFETSYLKKVVHTPKELVTAIQGFSAMNNAEYVRNCKGLREYIDGYFVKPTEACVAAFLPSTSRAGTH